MDPLDGSNMSAEGPKCPQMEISTIEHRWLEHPREYTFWSTLPGFRPNIDLPFWSLLTERLYRINRWIISTNVTLYVTAAVWWKHKWKQTKQQVTIHFFFILAIPYKNHSILNFTKQYSFARLIGWNSRWKHRSGYPPPSPLSDPSPDCSETVFIRHCVAF